MKLGALLPILLAATSYAGPLYNPVGPQHNVSISTVTGGGWTQCYAAGMDVPIGGTAGAVLDPCQGDLLMMAGRVTGSDTLLLLAQASFADVTFNTGVDWNFPGAVHIANGTEWYFAENFSWGFAALGDSVRKEPCDTEPGANRMCLHTSDVGGGYRIGNITGVKDDSYEKIFFVASDTADVPEPITSLLLGICLASMAVVVRRHRSL